MRPVAGLAAVALALASPAFAAELEVRPAAAASGLYGLEVRVGSTCTATDDVVVTAPPTTIGGLYEACHTLTAAGVEVGAAGAEFVAGESIALGAGFAVTPGASFSAVIDPTLATAFAAVSTAAPSAEQTFHARFQLRLDGLALAENEEIDHFHAEAADGTSLFRLVLRRQGGQDLLVLGARLDGGGEILTPAGQETVLPPGWNEIELDWLAGDGDGHLLVSVNQSAFAGLTGLANGLAAVDRFRWGAVDGSFAGAPGILEADDLRAWR